MYMVPRRALPALRDHCGSPRLAAGCGWTGPRRQPWSAEAGHPTGASGYNSLYTTGDMMPAALLRTIAAFALLLALTAAAPPSPPPSGEALETALDLFEEAKYPEAIKVFRQADKLANGACADCQLGLARAYNKVGAHKEALKSAEAVLRLTTDLDHVLTAYHEQGMAWLASAAGDPAKLQEAEKAFRQALERSQGKVNAARFNLGVTLLRMERDSEGAVLLKEYLAREPEGKSAEQARELVKNPVRARKNLLPDFAVATLAGDYVSSDDLRGKVVLLDFWATWCAPCRAAIPELRSLSRRRAKDPFVLLSISVDQDEKALRELVAQSEMTWPQVWDKNSEIYRKLNAKALPTYVLVDPEGEIVYTATGWGPSVEREIESRVFSAVRRARKSVPREPL